MDALDRRMISTAEQLEVVEKALIGWGSNNAEESQALEFYKG